MRKLRASLVWNCGCGWRKLKSKIRDSYFLGGAEIVICFAVRILRYEIEKRLISVEIEMKKEEIKQHGNVEY